MRVLAFVVALATSVRQVASAGGIDFDLLAPNASLSTAPGSRHLAELASPTCALVADVDFAGNDIANVQAPAASGCCAKCSAQSGCGAFTWTNWNGGTCWLKSKKGTTTTAKPGAQSAELVTSSDAACPTLEAGVDYVANDIGNVAAPAAADCCAKCSAKPGCGAFTWTNWNGGTCWLKSGKGATKANPDATSGLLAPSSSSCATPETNVDYYGADIANVPGSGAPDCCNKCSAHTGCSAFTWTSANGGTCWLKNGTGSPRTLTGAVSAVVSATTTAPPTQPPASGHIQSKLRSGELPLRSVNLGGWLVGEYWMSFTSPAWTDTNGVGWDGEYLTMKALGKTKGAAQFEQHRATWITESDIQQIAAAGMNAVRVPVGFWIMYDDPSIAPTAVSQVFAPGALKYLDTLVNDWAVKYNLAVMLSLHAHQGSQNGYDHSSPLVKGTTSWSDSQANIDNSLQFATFLAARYKDSAAFLGMNLMNEPSFPTDYNRLFGYYQEAYTRIRATGNNCILVTSPMIQEQGPPVMMNFMRWPAYFNVWHEFHVYYKWGWDNTNVDMILNGARSYRASHLDNWSGNWIYMGEWSLATPDSIPITDRNQLKQFAAIQMAGFEGAHSGWAFWSWRHDDETLKLSGWSLRQLLREGILTVPRVN